MVDWTLPIPLIHPPPERKASDPFRAKQEPISSRLCVQISFLELRLVGVLDAGSAFSVLFVHGAECSDVSISNSQLDAPPGIRPARGEVVADLGPLSTTLRALSGASPLDGVMHDSRMLVVCRACQLRVMSARSQWASSQATITRSFSMPDHWCHAEVRR